MCADVRDLKARLEAAELKSEHVETKADPKGARLCQEAWTPAKSRCKIPCEIWYLRRGWVGRVPQIYFGHGILALIRVPQICLGYENLALTKSHYLRD